MFIMFLFTIFIMSLSFFILLINFSLSKKMFNNREKLSPFECGFNPITPPHSPFSNQFFIISLMFLIFDIEITLLIPLIYMMSMFTLSMMLISLIFLILLILSLYLEYLEQSIDWKK